MNSLPSMERLNELLSVIEVTLSSSFGTSLSSSFSHPYHRCQRSHSCSPQATLLNLRYRQGRLPSPASLYRLAYRR
jgi:hypothetical protein